MVKPAARRLAARFLQEAHKMSQRRAGRLMKIGNSSLRDAELIAPGIALTGQMAKPHHNPFEPVKPMTESEELKARLKEITKLPDRTAYCWLKAFTDKAVRMRTPLVPLPHELAGCSQKELADFMKSERVGQGVTKDEIKEIVRGGKSERDVNKVVASGAGHHGLHSGAALSGRVGYRAAGSICSCSEAVSRA